MSNRNTGFGDEPDDAVSQWFWRGLSPVAPGTVGSLLGIACFYPLLGVSRCHTVARLLFVACAVAIGLLSEPARPGV